MLCVEFSILHSPEVQRRFTDWNKLCLYHKFHINLVHNFTSTKLMEIQIQVGCLLVKGGSSTGLVFWCEFCNKGVFFRKFQTFHAATPLQGSISAVNSNFCLGSYNGCLILAVCCYRCTVVRVDTNDCLANLFWLFGSSREIESC